MSIESINNLESRLRSVIKASRVTEEISYGEIIGMLELIKLDLYQETFEDDNDYD